MQCLRETLAGRNEYVWITDTKGDIIEPVDRETERQAYKTGTHACMQAGSQAGMYL